VSAVAVAVSPVSACADAKLSLAGAGVEVRLIVCVPALPVQ
jgi:hypothetical protein